MKRQLVNIGKFMLLALFISSYISATAFYHTHHFSWGTVTHSHPYLPSDDNPSGHTHTQNEYLVITLLSTIVLTIPVTAFFLFRATLIQRVYTWTRRYESFTHPVFYFLRGPPVAVSH